MDNFESIGNCKLDVFKTLFLFCLRPYVQLLNHWFTKGEDEQGTLNEKEEFFIKGNYSLFQ